MHERSREKVHMGSQAQKGLKALSISIQVPRRAHESSLISLRLLPSFKTCKNISVCSTITGCTLRSTKILTTYHNSFFPSLRKIKVPVSKPKIAACLSTFYSRILKSRPKTGRVLCSPAAQQSGFHAHSNTKEINSLCDQRHFWVVKSNPFTSDTTALLSIWKWRENSPLPPRNSKTKNQYIREKQAHQRVLSQNT